MVHREMLDRYARMESPVHRRPAWLKLSAGVGLVAVALAVPRYAWWVYGLEAAVLVVVVVVSRIPPWFLVRKVLWMEPVLVGVALMALWQPDGWRGFVALLVRSTVCLLSMVTVAATTPFGEVLRVLERLRVPPLLLTTLALAFRYQFVLLEESERMRRARASRTFVSRKRFEWEALSTVVAHLFLRATDRAARIHAAMVARGWKG